MRHIILLAALDLSLSQNSFNSFRNSLVLLPNSKNSFNILRNSFVIGFALLGISLYRNSTLFRGGVPLYFNFILSKGGGGEGLGPLCGKS